MNVYGTELRSRLIMGTGLFPSPATMCDCVVASGAAAVTASLRRETGQSRKAGSRFFELLKSLYLPILPNTAGCHTVREAVTTAQMAREVFGTNWIKLEIIGEQDTLQPDVFALVEAARILTAEHFKVFPYTTEDLVVADKLVNVGCEVLMPWGSPIGSARGLNNIYGLRTLRHHFPNVPIIIDAGIGMPSHAAQAMELGCDGILLNTAIAKAAAPTQMAAAFAMAVEGGRHAYLAGGVEPREMAYPSTPVTGRMDLG